MAAPAIGLQPRVVPGPGAHVDWSHPLARHVHALHTPYRVMSAPGLNAAAGLRTYNGPGGHGLTGPANTTSNSVEGFQTGPWCYLIAITPTAIPNLNIMAMAESPGSTTTDRILCTRSTGAYRGYLFDGANKIVTSTTFAGIGRMDVVALQSSRKHRRPSRAWDSPATRHLSWYGDATTRALSTRRRGIN
jgi:hypothetical protein